MIPLPAFRACSCHRYLGGWRHGVTPAGWWSCVNCGGLHHPPAQRFTVAMKGGMVGKTYLEAGERVTVLAQWRGKGCPRNVVVRDAKGNTKVRPARGLRLS